MSDAFLGEVRAFAFNFAPSKWAQCNGELVRIAQNAALFSLLSNRYGGDGVSTFGLPNLSGAAVIGAGDAPGLSHYCEGDGCGESQVTLMISELPPHQHIVNARSGPESEETGTPSNTTEISRAIFGSSDVSAYSTTLENPSCLMPLSVGSVGNFQSHDNLQPVLGLYYCICLSAPYPGR